MDEETQKFIAQSLTDVDLFASYGLTQKAIGLLEAILRRAPGHTPTLEKLLDFVLGAGDDRRTAELAARLEKIHSAKGDNRNAERFAELRRRFQRAAGLSDSELAAASESALTEPSGGDAGSSEQAFAEEEIPTFEIAPETVPSDASGVQQATASQAAGNNAQDIHEVDLSDEWMAVLQEVEPEKPVQQSVKDKVESTNAPAEAPVAKTPAAPEVTPEFVIADSNETSEPAREFEITIEPESVEPIEEVVQASTNQHSEASPSSVLPADMPVFAEFQVPQAPPPALEEPSFAYPTPSSEQPQEISYELNAAEPSPSEKQPEPFELAAVEEAPVLEQPAPEEVSIAASFELEAAAEAAESSTDEQKPGIPQVEPSELQPVVPKLEEQIKEVGGKSQKQPAEEPEFELDQDYDLILDPEPLVPAYDQKPPEVAGEAQQAEPEHATVSASFNHLGSDQFMADLASEIENLGMGQLTPPNSNSHTHAQAPVKTISASNQSDSGPLKEVFDDFRAELGEMGAEDEDLETHYNLGTAFREMGLLEEAISEFQKVAKANESGRPFRYAMQCCTLLGLAFMEKGQPGIAAIWYERALLTPGVEPESILALRYDLGIAQESAGEPEAALKSFSKVYAMNIDYRDVAERIAALQKPSR